MAECVNGEPRAGRRQVGVGRAPLDPAAVLADVSVTAAGANVLFVGTVRSVTAGIPTSRLEYDAHEPLALAVLESIRREAVERFGLAACRIEHRLGPVEPGEASVAVAVSSPHRREAFAAGEWAMERIKREVPIWKREQRPDGSGGWVHGDESPRTEGER